MTGSQRTTSEPTATLDSRHSVVNIHPEDAGTTNALAARDITKRENPYHSSDSLRAGMYAEKPNEFPRKLPGLNTWQPSYVIWKRSYLSAKTT